MKNILEEIAITIFRSNFTKFEGWEEFEGSEIGLIPKGWKAVELGEYLSIAETGSRPRGGIKGINVGVPSIGAESIIGLGKFDFNKTKYVPMDFYEKMNRGKLSDFDVLIYKDGGKPGQFEPHISLFGNGFPYQKMCINEHVFRARVKEPLTQSFLYFWLTSPMIMEEMRRRGTGVAIPGLNSTSLKELPLLVPDKESIKKFDIIAKPIIEKILLDSLPFE